jgi:Fis family transcriptional regulator
VKAQLENLTLQMYKGGITYLEGVREFQKAFIRFALQEHKGNQCRTAKKLGMHRNTLSRAIRDLQLDIQSIRGTQRRRPPQGDPSGTLMKREG